VDEESEAKTKTTAFQTRGFCRSIIAEALTNHIK
jgi:hypothetical protein